MRMSAEVFQSTEGAGTNKPGALKTTSKASMAKAQHTRRKVVFGAERLSAARSQVPDLARALQPMVKLPTFILKSMMGNH